MDDQLNKDGASTNANPAPQSSDPMQGAPVGAPEPTPAPGGVTQGPAAENMSSDPMQGAPVGAPEPTPAPGGVTQGEPVKTDDPANGNA